jgi:histidine triad (HIT) family protein
MGSPDDCIFCRIVARELPSSSIYEDERVLAFMDIQPVNPGHTLVIPKRHAAYLADLTSDLTGHMAVTGQRVAAAIRASGLRCEGINFFLADGVAAGQEVFHVHLHVFPRFAGDGFGLRFGPNYKQRPPRSELDAAATKLRKVLR